MKVSKFKRPDHTVPLGYVLRPWQIVIWVRKLAR